MRRGPPYKARPLPPAETDYKSEWASMQNWGDEKKQPRSQEEFHRQVQRAMEARKDEEARRVRAPVLAKGGDLDSEEEERLSFPPGRCGEWFFRLLCPRNPYRARRRVERVYWLSWRSFVYGVFLSGIGAMLWVLGCLWTYYGEERLRGVGVLFAATLLCIPGFYSLFVLFMYVAGKRGYSYRQLPTGY